MLFLRLLKYLFDLNIAVGFFIDKYFGQLHIYLPVLAKNTNTIKFLVFRSNYSTFRYLNEFQVN